MEMGDIESFQPGKGVAIEFDRVGVTHVIEGGERRQPDADTIRAPHIDQRRRHLEKQGETFGKRSWVACSGPCSVISKSFPTTLAQAYQAK